MKKIMILLAICLLGRSVYVLCDAERACVYAVSVKSMPFWTFWNYQMALKCIAEKTGKSISAISNKIKLKQPILLTTKYHEAQDIKVTLQTYRCDAEIEESSLVMSDEELAAVLFLEKIVDSADKEFLSSGKEDTLDNRRAAFIKALEEDNSEQKK